MGRRPRFGYAKTPESHGCPIQLSDEPLELLAVFTKRLHIETIESHIRFSIPHLRRSHLRRGAVHRHRAMLLCYGDVGGFREFEKACKAYGDRDEGAASVLCFLPAGGGLSGGEYQCPPEDPLFTPQRYGMYVAKALMVDFPSHLRPEDVSWLLYTKFAA